MEKLKFILIHGIFGDGTENWFPWLKGKLEEDGHEVIVPKFPTPEGQNLDNWMKKFEKYADKLDHKTVFVAHSMGAAFVLNVLESINREILGCVFVAGFASPLGNPEFDDYLESFIDKDFNWEKITNNCEKFIVINSRDDPYVPVSKGITLAEKLDTGCLTFDTGGHFNEEAGFLEFKELLNIIKKEFY